MGTESCWRKEERFRPRKPAEVGKAKNFRLRTQMSEERKGSMEDPSTRSLSSDVVLIDVHWSARKLRKRKGVGGKKRRVGA